MLRWRLRTVLVAVAVVALVLATLVPAFRDLGVYHATAWVRANDAPLSIQQLNSPEAWAIVASDPAVAALPEIRGASDPGAAVGRLVRAEIIPGTHLIQIAGHSTSPTTATTLANVLTARSALDASSKVVATATTARRNRTLGPLLRLVVGELLGLVVLGLIGWGVARLVARARPSGSADRAALEASAGIVDPWPRA